MKVHHIFWHGPGNATAQKSVHLGMPALLEGEQNLPVAGSKQAAAPSNPSFPPSPKVPDVPRSIETWTPTQASQPKWCTEQLTQLQCSMQTQKPSHFVQDSQAGEGIILICQAPKPKPPVLWHVQFCTLALSHIDMVDYWDTYAY